MRSAVPHLASIAAEVLAGAMELRRKRAYDTAESSDGFRVLVDRLWPREQHDHAVVLDEALRKLL